MGSENFKNNTYDYNENIELLSRAKSGDLEAMDKLIKINLPLVSAITKKFLNRGYEYDDIYQIGSVGLVKAIKNFNNDFNVKFSTYAVPMIIGEIKRFLRDDGMIKVSRNVKSLSNKIHFFKEELAKKLNRAPTIEELSEYSGVDKEEIIFAIESSSTLHSIYETIHKEDGAPVLLIDKLTHNNMGIDDNFIEKIELKEAIMSLDAKSRQIIILRYFRDKTQIEVAKMLGISQVQVSRIEKKVISMIRERMS
ncbi:RNA polymerase sporulation sigma factor SigF [Clostridium sp. BJN0001]|uniref:RNA polymerase sporulation sigma factor SigF n=1 Tax=Clostridium sp. BJN0001 TaxID=2930219 RepID=UPI001FD4506C|nr:RNA polymerase sporulation sigma factor SigF [Clostridium sp. BJN0001]